MSASNGELIVSGRQRDLMIQAATLAGIVAMIFNCGVAIAGPNPPSADYIMPGCRDAASLEPISKSPEEDDEAGELDKTEEVLCVELPADEDATLPLYPGEEALDEPASHIAA